MVIVVSISANHTGECCLWRGSLNVTDGWHNLSNSNLRRETLKLQIMWHKKVEFYGYFVQLYISPKEKRNSCTNEQ